MILHFRFGQQETSNRASSWRLATFQLSNLNFLLKYSSLILLVIDEQFLSMNRAKIILMVSVMHICREFLDRIQLLVTFYSVLMFDAHVKLLIYQKLLSGHSVLPQ